MADNFLANSLLDTLNEQLKIIESEPQNQMLYVKLQKFLIASAIMSVNRYINMAFSIDPTNRQSYCTNV